MDTPLEDQTNRNSNFNEIILGGQVKQNVSEKTCNETTPEKTAVLTKQPEQYRIEIGNQVELSKTSTPSKFQDSIIEAETEKSQVI